MTHSIDSTRIFRPMSLSFPIIHFTSNWETLEKIILENGFKPSYSRENLEAHDQMLDISFPMISFSCMEVKTAIIRIRSYGTLGIALKPEWAMRNKLNPVLYLERNSDFTKYIVSSFELLSEIHMTEILAACDGSRHGYRQRFIKLLIDTASYAKNFSGKLIRKGEVLYDENYSFGLEREWRYLYYTSENPLFLLKDEDREKHNQSIGDFRLKFDIEDIDSIIVETDDQQEEVDRLLRDQFGNSINQEKIIINPARHMYDYS